MSVTGVLGRIRSSDSKSDDAVFGVFAKRIQLDEIAV
jgi:hypothetical protein